MVWENSQHFAMPPVVSLKGGLRNEHRNSTFLLMMRNNPDLQLWGVLLIEWSTLSTNQKHFWSWSVGYIFDLIFEPNKFLQEKSICTGVGSYFPYILLNEIQMMFSQLAKRSARVLPADLCTDHAHYVKIHRSTVLRRNKNMAVEGGTVSHYYILVIRKFIDLMSLFRHSVWFSFSVKQFPSAEFDICNI